MTCKFQAACAIWLALSALPAAAEVAVSLPLGFDGAYAPEGVACGSDLVIVVKDGTMVGGDGAMTVTDLIEYPDPRKVEASLLVSGGGEEWSDSAMITLSPDGQSLSFDFADGTTTVWTRCP